LLNRHRDGPPRRQGDASRGAEDIRARFEERTDTHIPAKLIRANGSTQNVIIGNLSGTGLRLDGVSELAIGEHALILLADNQAREIAIRWIVGDQAGARFVA
jgi:hypothetical protein